MQFSIIGPTSTWDICGHGGNVYDPRDAILAAARMLVANCAPAVCHAAIFACNHADWYVAAVLAKAAEYRAATPLSPERRRSRRRHYAPSVTVPRS